MKNPELGFDPAQSTPEQSVSESLIRLIGQLNANPPLEELIEAIREFNQPETRLSLKNAQLESHVNNLMWARWKRELKKQDLTTDILISLTGILIYFLKQLPFEKLPYEELSRVQVITETDIKDEDGNIYSHKPEKGVVTRSALLNTITDYFDDFWQGESGQYGPQDLLVQWPELAAVPELKKYFSVNETPQ